MAADVQAPLQVAPTFDQLGLPTSGCWQLGLAGAHQKVNASLAVQLAATWEQLAGHSCGAAGAAGADQRAQSVQQLRLPDDYAAGLKECVWPGRAQVSPALESSHGCQPRALIAPCFFTGPVQIYCIACERWTVSASAATETC